MTVRVLSWDRGRRIRSWRHGVRSPVAHRPTRPGLQTGCSCEPVVYFHLAVLARCLKENPMTIAAVREAREEKRKEREWWGGLMPVPRHAYASE